MSNTILITMGDGAGIGPEIIARAFREAPAELANCVVIGDVATLRRAAALVAKPLALPVVVLEGLTEASLLQPLCIQMLQKCRLTAPVSFGQVSAVAGTLMIASALNSPEIKSRLLAEGAEPVGNTAAQFQTYIRTEITQYAKIVTALKIGIDR